MTVTGYQRKPFKPVVRRLIFKDAEQEADYARYGIVWAVSYYDPAWPLHIGTMFALTHREAIAKALALNPKEI